MIWLKWLGRVSISERAKKEVDQIKRDLYDAQKNQALWNKQCEFYQSEIERLTPIAEYSDRALPFTADPNT